MKLCNLSEAAKILRHPDEYDETIPNLTLTEYVVDKMREFGNDIACVIKMNYIDFDAVNLLIYQ